MSEIKNNPATVEVSTKDSQAGFISASESRIAMRMAIISACFGAIPAILVSSSSVIILYATMLDASRFVSLCTTSLDSLSSFLLCIPLAYLTHRYGKKKLVIPAMIVGAAGLAFTATAPWFGGGSNNVLMSGLIIFSLMSAIYTAGWFPLLKDIVPAGERGRFFGRMRTSWQITACVFLFITSAIVRFSPSLQTFQIIIAISSIGFIVRSWYIHKIPEKQPVNDNASLFESLRTVLRNQPLLGFGTYLFWLYIFAGSLVPVAILMGKLYLKMENDFLVLLSSCLMLGNIAGYFFGGRMVDKRGTKKVFLFSHFSFGILSLMLLSIQNDSTLCKWLLISIVMLYGMVYSAASIAVSSEAFALVPHKHPEMSLAVCLGLYYAGLGLSRFLVGWVLDSGMLSPRWSMGPLQLTQYHTLFLVSAFGVIVTCVLLVMIPSVMGKSQMLPDVR